MKVVIGTDHAGFAYKTDLIETIKTLDHSITDVGTDGSESVDYPDFAEKVSNMVSSGQADIGILLCGSGIGMDIAANKVNGIRCASCWSVETARLARTHNGANVLSMGARLLPLERCIEITKTFLSTPSTSEDRHLRRIEKIKKIEERN